jgi:uncharacterized OB-fold protein
MSDMPPFPLPDVEFAPIAPLWAAAARGIFSLPRCQRCGRFDWYPTGRCEGCDGGDIAWTDLSGRATLYTWATVRRALHPPLAALGRYVSAIVTIEEDPSVRFVTRLVDVPAERLRAGLPLAVRFADLGYPAIETGVVAPLFTLTE